MVGKKNGMYEYWSDNGSLNKRPISYAYNHPTPAHLFEQHTQLQMKGFLNSLESDIEKGKYSKNIGKRRGNK